MTTSFVHVEYPSNHPGVQRFERALDAASNLGKNFTAARSLAGVLLAAMVATLLVAADQLIANWTDGHLLAAWVFTWLVGFAALALLAPAARTLALRTTTALNTWSSELARRRADERLMALARLDPRVMADIRAAALRAEVEVSAPVEEEMAQPAVAQDAVASDKKASQSEASQSARLARLSRRIWNE